MSTKKPRRRFGIPRTIKIRQQRWRIFIEPETSMYRKEVADGKTLAQEQTLGWCYPEAREIHLARELRGRRLETVFIHEILHAVQPTAPIMSYEQEERVVEEMSAPLAGVIGRLVRKRHGRR